MKTLELADGDLVVTPVGHRTISGAPKIKQEVSAALIEPYGNDRFHRDYGSTVRNLIGEVFDAETTMLAEAEVNRVLQAYIVTQRNEVLSDNLDQRRSRFDARDVVRAITDLRVTGSYDAMRISLTFVTLSGERVTLTNEVNA